MRWAWERLAAFSERTLIRNRWQQNNCPRAREYPRNCWPILSSSMLRATRIYQNAAALTIILYAQAHPPFVCVGYDSCSFEDWCKSYFDANWLFTKMRRKMISQNRCDDWLFPVYKIMAFTKTYKRKKIDSRNSVVVAVFFLLWNVHCLTLKYLIEKKIIDFFNSCIFEL